MSKKVFFGTDGIRGYVNNFPITSDFFLQLGYALSFFLKNKKRKKVLIGNDTRESAHMIESALTSGLLSMGVDCEILGSVPTPVVSYMTKLLSADAGIMISASHNPYYDNGIKIFLQQGEKLTDKQEVFIEKLILSKKKYHFCDSRTIGKSLIHNSNFNEYRNNIKKVIPTNVNFKNFKVVIDCANGSAYKIAPQIFLDLDINLTTLSITPNGKNINEKCGALSPEKLIKKVISTNSHIGFAFDGDADRLIVCDEIGNIIDGDQILALVANSLHKQNKLLNDCIVATKMSNLGLRNYLKNIGVELFLCDVGDRYVIDMMQKKKANLGGEQSGHIIFSEFSSTGDAILSSLQILTILKLEKKSLSELLKSFVKIPQKLINLKLNSEPEKILMSQKLSNLINFERKNLSNKGSILIRKSGTEKLLRIMVQSEDYKIMNKIINKLVACVKSIDKVS